MWTGAENSPPPGFDPRTVRPVASRYTDRTNPARGTDYGKSRNRSVRMADIRTRYLGMHVRCIVQACSDTVLVFKTERQIWLRTASFRKRNSCSVARCAGSMNRSLRRYHYKVTPSHRSLVSFISHLHT